MKTADALDMKPGDHGPMYYDKERGDYRVRCEVMDYDRSGVIKLRWKTCTGKSREKADKRMQTYLKELAKRFPHGRADDPKRRPCTVGEAIESYMAVKVRGHNAPRTVIEYQCKANDVIAALDNGKLRVDFITTDLLRTRLWEPRRKRSKERLALLHRALVHVNAETAAEVLRLPAVMKAHLTADQKRAARKTKRQAASDDDVKLLLETVKDSPQWLAFFYLAAFCGARLSELLNFTRDDYDEREGTLYVVTGKTDAAERFIFLGNKARKLIDRMLIVQRVAGYKGPWLFPAVEGGVYNANNFQKQVFNRYMLAAGLATKIGKGAHRNDPGRERKHNGVAANWTLHCLRHRAFTRDRALMPGPFVDAQLGHQNAARADDPNAASLATYWHPDAPEIRAQRRAYAESVDKLVSKLLPRATHLSIV